MVVRASVAIVFPKQAALEAWMLVVPAREFRCWYSCSRILGAMFPHPMKKSSSVSHDPAASSIRSRGVRLLCVEKNHHGETWGFVNQVESLSHLWPATMVCPYQILPAPPRVCGRGRIRDLECNCRPGPRQTQDEAGLETTCHHHQRRSEVTDTHTPRTSGYSWLDSVTDY